MRLNACYDLACSPPTYDFVSFLVGAELERIDRGADTIAVHVLPGPAEGFRQDKLPPFNLDERRRMRDEIVLPMAKLLPSCEWVRLADDRENPPAPSFGWGQVRYGFGTMMRAARNNCYPLRAPSNAPRLALRRYVTITLRECDYWPSRNSNVEEWIAVAAGLQKRGFTPIMVRDTARAHELIDGIANSPQAAQDISFRASLYAHAEMNLFVNNGPAWMCLFLGAPTLITKMASADAPVVSPQFFAAHGLPPDSEWPNAKPRQRIAWIEDNRADILREFDKVMECNPVG